MIYKVCSLHIIRCTEQIIQLSCSVLIAKHISFVVISPGPVWEPSSHLRSGRQHVPQHDDRPGEPVRHHQVWGHSSRFLSRQDILIPSLSLHKTRWSVRLSSWNIPSADTEREKNGKNERFSLCQVTTGGRGTVNAVNWFYWPVMCSAEPVKGT